MFFNTRRVLIPALCAAFAFAIFAPAARAADIVAHGQTCSTAIPVLLNAKVSVALAGTNDVAVYKIMLDRRGLIDVWDDPGNFDISTMDLLDSSCHPVPGVHAGLSVISGKYAKITVPSPLNGTSGVWTLDPGTYFIRLNPDPLRVSGEVTAFETRFTPHFGHDCMTAEPVALSKTIDGDLLYAQDREVFAVEIPGPGRLHVWTTGVFLPDGEPEVDLNFPDCTSAFEQQVPDESGTGFIGRIFDPGTYYVSVMRYMVNPVNAFTLHAEFIPDRLDWKDILRRRPIIEPAAPRPYIY